MYIIYRYTFDIDIHLVKKKKYRYTFDKKKKYNKFVNQIIFFKFFIHYHRPILPLVYSSSLHSQDAFLHLLTSSQYGSLQSLYYIKSEAPVTSRYKILFSIYNHYIITLYYYLYTLLN